MTMMAVFAALFFFSASVGRWWVLVLPSAFFGAVLIWLPFAGTVDDHDGDWPASDLIPIVVAAWGAVSIPILCGLLYAFQRRGE